MKLRNKLKILLIILVLFFSSNTVFSTETSHAMDRIDYMTDFDGQKSVEQELFEKDEYSDDEYYNHTLYSLQKNEDFENAILLEKNDVKNKKRVVLKTGIEKSYKINRIESFNTIWDDSRNFRTTIYSTPSLMDTLPSLMQESHFRFNADETTQIDWGHTSLSSHDNMTVGFIDNMENIHDNGMRISSKLGNINISGAIFDSIQSQNPSGGLVFSTREFKTKYHKGSFVFGGGVYASDYANENSKNSAGIFTKYKYGRFSLGIQIAQSKSSAKNSQYETECYLYPSFKINNSLTLTGGISSHIYEQSAKEEIGITYKPFINNKNDFSISLKAVFYNGRGVESKQKIKIKTEFKL